MVIFPRIFELFMKYFIPFILLISVLHWLPAQTQELELTGKVVQGSTPIYNVTVANKSTYSGTITDVYGSFNLLAHPGDTISFSCIGFKQVSYRVPDSISSDSYRILVNMVADTILLKEAMVVPWPQNTTMLKQAMLAKRSEKEKISPYAGFIELEGDPVEPDPKPFANPISFLFDKFSKKNRQAKKMEKYRQILQEDEVYEPEQIY